MPEAVYNPFTGSEEVLFKDADGQLKVLRGGIVEPWRSAVPTAVPLLPASVPAALPSQSSPVESFVEQVIKELALPLPDPVLQKRLRTHILARFKDVRDAIETREAMARPLKVGGLGFTAEQAETSSVVIERHYRRFSEASRRQQDQAVAQLQANVSEVAPLTPSAPVPAAPIAPPRRMSLQPLPPAALPPTVPPLPPVRPPTRPPLMSRPSAAVSPVPSAVPLEPPSLPVPTRFPQPVPAVPPLAPPAMLPPVARATEPFTPSPEPMAEEVPAVRYRPQLVGPLEEIGQMTLQDFRRLDADPRRATDRLREKIVLLEQQSFAHKAAAIAAWRSCEVFNLYTATAGRAMAEKRPISEMLGSNATPGTSILSVAEFEAIADFNRTLRF
ncbi:MAG: hypothetical protein Q7S23_02065 [bacterium]|nr:hypothetical protein [bacterium]